MEESTARVARLRQVHILHGTRDLYMNSARACSGNNGSAFTHRHVNPIKLAGRGLPACSPQQRSLERSSWTSLGSCGSAGCPRCAA